MLLGPLVLHPFRRTLTPDQIAQADQVFFRVRAKREDFIVRSSDGVVLRGWKIRAADPNGDWVLLFHGRSHNRFVMLPYAEFLLKAGYSVVMMDARAHGSSGGTMSTYGYLERHDATAIIDALKNPASQSAERIGHIYALGESMGAATALQSAAVEPRIEAVVAEGAFRNLQEVAYDYAGLHWSAFLGKTLFRPIAVITTYEAQREGGFQFEEVSPEKAVAARPFAVLLICGREDTTIPQRHADAIFRAAAGPKQLWIVPRAGHEKALPTNPEEFRRRVLAFFSNPMLASR